MELNSFIHYYLFVFFYFPSLFYCYYALFGSLQPRGICLETAKYYKFILYFTMLFVNKYRFDVNLEFQVCSFLNR